MKVTFILKNKTESFYEKLSSLQNAEVFEWLKYASVFPKIGNDTFREKLDFNVLFKSGGNFSAPKIEARRGYKLLTIHLT